MGCINETQGAEEQGVAGITLVVGQKEQVQKKDKFSSAEGEK